MQPTYVIQPKERPVNDTIVAHTSVEGMKPSVIPGYAMIEDLRVSENAFLDPSTGRALWTARATRIFP